MDMLILYQRIFSVVRQTKKDIKQFYTRPPKREPLSDEEVMRLGVLNCCNEANSFKPFGFARAIEKEHGIGVDDE